MVDFLTENNYTQQIQNIVLPYLQERRTDGFFSGSCGHAFFYATFRADHSVGTVTMLHGFTESLEKYVELIYYFLLEGFNVCIYDQRGHGRSYHETATIHETHIQHLESCVADLHCFTEQVVSHFPEPHYLYGHSMGGGIASLYLEKYHDFFQKASLECPLIQPRTFGLPLCLSRWFFGFFCLIGLGKKRMVTHNAYPGEEHFEGSCCTCSERYYYYEMMKRKYSYFQNYCGTNRFAYESLKLRSKILKKGNPESITIPVLVFSGEIDQVVQNEPQKEFASRVPNASYILYPGMNHELYISPNKDFVPYFETVLRFFKEL